MVLFIWNVASFKLSSSSEKMQHFVQNKFSSTSQLIRGKSKGLQKLPRLVVVELLLLLFSIIFVIYLNDFIVWNFIINTINCVSIIIQQTSWCHKIIITIFWQILLWHDYVKIVCIAYQFFVDYWYAWPILCIIFHCNIFSRHIVHTSSKIYCPFHNNMCIILAT